MATLIHRGALAALVVIAGCDNLIGFDGAITPLVTMRVQATGDFESVRVPNARNEDLQVAVVWGTQWLPEPLCFLPPESPEVATTVAAGCRNPLSFTPIQVTSGVALSPNAPTDLSLYELPAADLLFGSVTARVAYASLVIYDDRDHSGTLELARAHRQPTRGFDEEEDMSTKDIVYGASFVAMTEPDSRLAYREGTFIETGYFPRHGCGQPLPAFSILTAGGFSILDAVVATQNNMLPSQDPTTCSEARPEDTIVKIPLRPTAEVREAGCEQHRLDSSVRYREPPEMSPDLTMRPFACAKIPSLSGDTSSNSQIQLVIGTAPDETCKGITHYTLLGCDEGKLECDHPEWDYRATPPAWWPCPQAVQ